MPIDALFLTALRSELEPRALGCRVDKVQQPARDTVLLSLRGAALPGRHQLTGAGGCRHPREAQARSPRAEL